MMIMRSFYYSICLCIFYTTLSLSATSLYIRCFQRLVKKSIDNAQPIMELFHVTPFQCLDQCILSTNNPSSKEICRSVVYNHFQHSCRLYHHDGTEVPAIIHPAMGFDYFRRTATTQECQGPAQYMLKIKTRIKNNGFPDSQFKPSEFPRSRSLAGRPNEYPVAPIDPKQSSFVENRHINSSSSHEIIENPPLNSMEQIHLSTNRLVKPRIRFRNAKEIDFSKSLQGKIDSIARKLGILHHLQHSSKVETINSKAITRGSKTLRDSMARLQTKQKFAQLLQKFDQINSVSINALTTVKPSLQHEDVRTLPRIKQHGVINRADENESDMSETIDETYPRSYVDNQSGFTPKRAYSKRILSAKNPDLDEVDNPPEIVPKIPLIERKEGEELPRIKATKDRAKEEDHRLEIAENKPLPRHKINENTLHSYETMKESKRGLEKAEKTCKTLNGYYVVTGNEIILPISAAENSVKVFHGISVEDCASFCSLGKGPKNERFKCSSMNFFPRMQRCEIYNILAEPHGPGNLIVNDDVVYAEKFCLPSSHAKCNPDTHFVLQVQKKIEKNIIKTTFANSITTCLQQCLNSFKCKTASFDSNHNKCYLSSINAKENPNYVVNSEEGWVLIENSCSFGEESKPISISLYQWSGWSECSYRIAGKQVRVRSRKCEDQCPDRGIQIERCTSRLRRA